ncbi:hypothetical protein [Mesobacillus zeae]|uniref:Uncharacterized protein n=1 Tax=Mesobacillus zeae TaxID=1917180 RepID=A0A398BBM8_9BACI|nr:hypothetical protein [Mesobacillus zeae]RID85043.1 hypothetical protein D1970_10785 [Mesobacillus zeae]
MELSRYAEKLLSQLNLYILPQYVWLIITYYLMINVFYDYSSHLFKNDIELFKKIPTEAFEFNSMVLGEINKWLPLVWFLSFAFLFSGLIIVLIRFFPFLENLKMSFHGRYGLFLGGWLLITAISIQLYNYAGHFFPLFIVAVALIKICGEEYFSKKNIFFNRDY